MGFDFPFLTSYDPPGTSEGTLDPLGLYQIADQLGVQLVPAVRERMQRIRFLTAMAVGALVTEGLADDPTTRDAAPYLLWEWLVVEALVRTRSDDPSIWGVPGTLVARRALSQHRYLDAASYLKTPRIFGFHGVYKRLALHLGLVNVHLGPGPSTELLVDAWARDTGLDGLHGARNVLDKWRAAIRRGQSEKPPRTKPGWRDDGWNELAAAFAPGGAGSAERRVLRRLLLGVDERRLGALPAIWRLQDEFRTDDFLEERLHDRLEADEPEQAPLLKAIRAYEAVARRLQDAFDLLRFRAAERDAQGYVVTNIGGDDQFQHCVRGLERYARAAQDALGQLSGIGSALANNFSQRFGPFLQPSDPGMFARAIYDHHLDVQKRKGDKRPWFDEMGGGRIFLRHAYRVPARELYLDRYVHEYRGWPIRRFRMDLQ